MNIEKRREFLKKGVSILANKWLSKEPEVSVAIWESALHGQLFKEARTETGHVYLLTDKFPQDPIPFACEEAGISTEKIPINIKVVFSFTEEKVVLKPLDGKWETLYEK